MSENKTTRVISRAAIETFPTAGRLYSVKPILPFFVDEQSFADDAHQQRHTNKDEGRDQEHPAINTYVLDARQQGYYRYIQEHDRDGIDAGGDDILLLVTVGQLAPH